MGHPRCLPEIVRSFWAVVSTEFEGIIAWVNHEQFVGSTLFMAPSSDRIKRAMNQASREFQIMVKPVGAVCNLDCGYCYYLQKKDLYPKAESFRMADDLLEEYIIQHIEACPKELIFFAWHGGEPTILGIDYFQRIIELQQKHRPPERTILNGIQTNGTLLDEEWCRFLARHRFQVGISMDGSKYLHDRYRVTKKGESTHKQVLQAYRLLRKYGIECDILCVLHHMNVRQPAAVYRFFRDIGVKYLQFLPLVMRQEGNETRAETVSADDYGNFLCTVFDEWRRHDIGRIIVQNFEEAMRPYLGEEHALCVLRETCGDVAVVEHNGDFYSCDHFVKPQHRLGNIRENRLVELLESPEQRAFGRRKRDGLPRFCLECEVLSSCNGGCPKDRFIRTPDGEEGLNYLCAGSRRFFTYSRPYLQRMAALRKSGFSEAKIASYLQAGDARATRGVGRNDPCPCGSGRKYKQCCLRETSSCVGKGH